MNRPRRCPRKPEEVDAKTAQVEEMNLTLDEDLRWKTAAARCGACRLPARPSEVGSSAIDLSGKGLEDDDLVLGGSGIGSDVSIGGDSGISLGRSGRHRHLAGAAARSRRRERGIVGTRRQRLAGSPGRAAAVLRHRAA